MRLDLTLLQQLIRLSPGDFGYRRSRWNTELLVIKINEIAGYRPSMAQSASHTTCSRSV